MLNSPVAASWPHVLIYPSWQNVPICQTGVRKPGQEGEVAMLRKEEKGFTFPSYYARTIELKPERRVIWKTYPEHRTPEADFFAIVDFELYEVDGQTRFCHSLLYKFLVSHRNEDDLTVFRKQQYDKFSALLLITLPKLKKIVEKAAA